MATSLIDKLETLTDKRRNEGKRHKISTIAIIAILSMISQIYSLQGFTAFAKRHKKRLIEVLQIEKDRIPSFTPIRNVLMNIDFNELASIIKEWIIENHLIDSEEWLSIDGKCIKSTVTDANDHNQNFISVVTAFTHQCGISILSSKYASKKSDEIAVVELMIDLLGLEGKVITLDALHGKKKLLTK